MGSHSVVIAFFGAFLSFVFSIISFMFFRAVKGKDDVQASKERARKEEIGRIWEVIDDNKAFILSKLEEHIDKDSVLKIDADRKIRDLELRRDTCRDLFVSQTEWNKIEDVKDRSLQEWKSQNKSLEDLLMKVIGVMRKNGI